ncbi:ATP-binding cassette domain-containing protein [Maribacter sp. MMG018]|uniref:ATP-binding cassette domain-containing protein n=1 Tax=Maribacter sp. MMG018 TaxID=2822688 RepID=UPI001B391102|nr:ATP-binding cassette domain-containing protein [Maribacter sp. MMG018]MBQ4914286.1 ATP-binding cassette domain-containing protein [Maribacter sp. MMG018]
MEHWGIFIDNRSNKSQFIKAVQNNELENFKNYKTLKGALFSPIALKRFIDEEERHGTRLLSDSGQSLKSMSSGEQKKALFSHILKTSPDYIILDNPFDNLDTDFQEELKRLLTDHSKNIGFIQLASRKSDMLPFITKYGKLEKSNFTVLNNPIAEEYNIDPNLFKGTIPPPIDTISTESNNLIRFTDVTVSYGDKTIIKNIDWEINKGEFWQLIGKNGSGKTTLLSMITGDNPKAFGQNIYLFGNKKGSGESVWEIKHKIGYFSPAMTDKFSGRHSIENMLISGLTDSIGLYTTPTEVQKRIIKQWLVLLNLWERRNVLFNELSLGEQRLIMTVRAMVKHPPLLILDEPTSGMDDYSAKILVALVNKMADESNTAIVFVSHRKEAGLKPSKIFQLTTSANGSTGTVHIP